MTERPASPLDLLLRLERETSEDSAVRDALHGLLNLRGDPTWAQIVVARSRHEPPTRKQLGEAHGVTATSIALMERKALAACRRMLLGWKRSEDERIR